MIHVEYLEVSYRQQPAVLHVARLDIAAGERVAIIGPSGSGKSTLLRSLKGYLQPVRGKVEVLGVNLAAPCGRARRAARREVNHRIGVVYQQFHLALHLTVLQNVLCGRLGLTRRWRSLLGWFSEQDYRAAWAAIGEVGLPAKVHQRADTLSGGEQQRVAIARAVAQQPDLILADEPVSSLDPVWADDVLALLVEVQQHHQATLVMSLHQPELARRFATRIIGLRQGRVVFDGNPARLTPTQLEDIYRGNTFSIESPAPTPAAGSPSAQPA
ncbi:MAG: phosphonate ABC transporter ATP-binding protein [Verrucomicrobiales bacterium]|nr:phosphonate ABC transporter ATP-binding protein [Verrucomicrobiales bacterium]